MMMMMISVLRRVETNIQWVYYGYILTLLELSGMAYVASLLTF